MPMRERRIVRLVMAISLAMVILIPSFNFVFLYPFFTKLLASASESNSLRVSVHLVREHVGAMDISDKDAISREISPDLRFLEREFELYHVNIYSASGQRVFESGSDKGSFEERTWPAFNLKGMKGPKVYTGKYAGNGEDGAKYLTEVTVPVIRNGRFSGAVQFFFDLTDFKERADMLMWTSSGFLLAIACGFLALVASASVRAGRALTETSKTQVALQLSERKFSQAFHNSPDWVILSRLSDGIIVEANNSFVKAKGLDNAEVLGKTAFELGIWKSEREREEVLKYLETRGSVRNVELHPYVAGGPEPAMLLSADIIQVKEERFILKVLRDVTDLRRAEQNELDLLRELRIIFDNIPVGVAYLDSEMRFISANRFFARFLGRDDAELVGKKCQETMVQFAGAKGAGGTLQGGGQCLCDVSSLRDSLETGKTLVIERVMGDVFARLTLVPERVSSGDMARLVLLLEDVTEQKRAEEEILGALKEKEVLLKEIHHRVKNNLQVISSLLSLQSRAVEDEELISMLRISQARVRSMALIHESLYQSEDLSLIDATRYLQQLGTYLFQSHGVNPKKVRLKLDPPGVRLSVELAVPCGLIVNELLTNSLKYAFPDGVGEIRVGLSRNEDMYRLVVKDNGVGYSDNGIRGKDSSLGLRLVNTLVDQLGGTMEMRSNGGVEVVVDFHAPEKKGELL
jgi:PAS domain S-box-containing protein